MVVIKDKLSQRAHLILVMDEERRTHNNGAVILACEVALRALDRDGRYKLYIEANQVKEFEPCVIL